MSGAMFVVLFSIVNTVGCVRYFFHWGDPFTSPTYSIIPTPYFWAWNLLTALVVLILVANLRRLHLLITIAYVVVALIASLVIFLSDNFYVAGAAKVLILTGFVFTVLAANAGWLDIRFVNKVIDLLGKTGILFLLFQIANYEIEGVLPSHSYEGSLIRFGSIYDDSLVMAIMLPMYVGFYLRKYSSPQLVPAVCLLGMAFAILTGSLTGIGIMAAYLVWCLRKSRKLLLAGALFGLLLFALRFDYFSHIWAFKGESIKGHMGGWSSLSQLEPTSLLGLFPQNIFVEIGYLSILLNFGLLVLLIMLGLLIYVFSVCVRTLGVGTTDVQSRMFYGAVEGLVFSVAIANFNFPVMVFPPVFLVLSFLSGIAVWRHNRAEHGMRIPFAATLVD